MTTDLRDLRVLVVDDEPVDAELMLRALGHAPMVSASAVHTVPAAQVLIRERDQDMVILDLHMPGYDGFHMLEWMRDEHPEIMVMVVTGSDHEADRKRALSLGALRVATKPTSRADFDAFMRSLNLGEIWLGSVMNRVQ